MMRLLHGPNPAKTRFILKHKLRTLQCLRAHGIFRKLQSQYTLRFVGSLTWAWHNMSRTLHVQINQGQGVDLNIVISIWKSLEKIREFFRKDWFRSRNYQGERANLHIGLIIKVIPFNLFLDIVPSSSAILPTRWVDVFVEDLFMSFRFKEWKTSNALGMSTLIFWLQARELVCLKITQKGLPWQECLHGGFTLLPALITFCLDISLWSG